MPNPLRGAPPRSPFTVPRPPRCRSSHSPRVLSTLASGQPQIVLCRGAGLAIIDVFVQVRCALHHIPSICPRIAAPRKKCLVLPDEPFTDRCRLDMPEAPRGCALARIGCEHVMRVVSTATSPCVTDQFSTSFFERGFLGFAGKHLGGMFASCAFFTGLRQRGQQLPLARRQALSLGMTADTRRVFGYSGAASMRMPISPPSRVNLLVSTLRALVSVSSTPPRARLASHQPPAPAYPPRQ